MNLSSSKLFRLLHFYLGNIYRLLTVVMRQKKVCPNDARTIFGASFGGDGWHHIIKTLEEYDINPSIHYKNTSMYVFLKFFKPKSICELIQTNSNRECNLPLFSYPWGTFKKGEFFLSKDPLLSRFCGPSQDLFIEEEFNRTISLYKEIKATGYRPWAYGNGFIGGTFLINKDGLRRFVILQGNHRMAILSHLKHEKIVVRDVRGNLLTVFGTDSKNWLLVQKKLCLNKAAKDIFSIFFEENGEHIYRLISTGQNNNSDFNSH
jgi:hypothetical protein